MITPQKSIRERLLSFIGVSSFEEMNEEERKTYSQWESALRGRELTSAEVRGFIVLQREEAIKLLTTTALNERTDTFLKMKVDFINHLLGFLDSPKAEREALEHVLNQTNNEQGTN